LKPMPATTMMTASTRRGSRSCPTSAVAILPRFVVPDKPYSSESPWSASFAYTYSWAKEKLEFNGDYQLDYPYAYNSLMVLSSQVPNNRLVAIGSVDLPWQMTLGAKLVIETPKPQKNAGLPQKQAPAVTQAEPQQFPPDRPYDPSANKVRQVGPQFLATDQGGIDLKHPKEAGPQPTQ